MLVLRCLLYCQQFSLYLICGSFEFEDVNIGLPMAEFGVAGDGGWGDGDI